MLPFYPSQTLARLDLDQEIEEEFETEIEAELEDDIEEELEDDIEEELEDDIEAELEDDIEAELEDDIEEELEGDIEAELEGDIEEELEGDIEEEFEGDLEEELDDDIEEEFEDDIEGEFEDDIEGEFEGDIEEEFDDTLEEAFEDESQESWDEDDYLDEDELADYYMMEYQAASGEEALDELVEEEETRQAEDVFTQDWLVLAAPGELKKLENLGYSIKNSQYLQALELTLATLIAPDSFDLHADASKTLTLLNTPQRAVDVDHIYYSATQTPESGLSIQENPATLLALPARSTHLGMIDGAISIEHPALRKASIKEKRFIPKQQTISQNHGTAVASILVGQSHTYKGLIPNATLSSAAVFFQNEAKKDVTHIRSLINALNWLTESQVKVVNMSLSGPDNRLLKMVVQRMCDKGVTIVAAVGNKGPLAPPEYPAAYPCAIAVTAVNQHQRIYRKAIRGKHLDIAAYGVNIKHADLKGHYSLSSGTSFAAPFVSAYLASYMPQDASRSDWLESLFQSCKDLGAKGHDTVFGYGLLPQTPIPIKLTRKETSAVSSQVINMSEKKSGH